MRLIDIPDLTEIQKNKVLEWFACKMCELQKEIGIECNCNKSYDPLTIEGATAHSYAYNFLDGGRHHDFGTITNLHALVEDLIIREIGNQIREEAWLHG